MDGNLVEVGGDPAWPFPDTNSSTNATFAAWLMLSFSSDYAHGQVRTAQPYFEGTYLYVFHVTSVNDVYVAAACMCGSAPLHASWHTHPPTHRLHIPVL